MTSNLLQASDLQLQRGRRTVLSNINLSINSGELVALIGPNGAGKSSLLKALAGLLPLAHGHVDVHGRALTDWPLPALAKARAYLAQASTVHWSLPVREVVALGRLPFASERLPAADAAAIDAAMQAADVLPLALRSITELSEGERARVLIARLFATGAPLLLADEPTAALDLAHQHQVLQLFRQHKNAGGSALLVLHDLNLAARYCDRILLLHEGRLHSQGRPAEVLTAATVRDVYGVEVELLQRHGVLQLVTAVGETVRQ